jgi:heat-inducible transcriptional repressor
LITQRPSTDRQLSERAQHFLKVLIERYIREGQPVGSRTLAKDAGMELSPATIRNVMSDLEEMGLVVSPHTSAGRVPTVSGYRLFVDSLMTLKPLNNHEFGAIREQLNLPTDAAHLVAAASRLLSGITRMAGVVMLPRHERIAYRQIEFMSLSNARVLTILITSEGEVHNRIIQVQRAYTGAELEQAANYLNQRFGGEDMREVRRVLVEEIKAAREGMDQIMRRAIEMAGQLVGGDEGRDDLLVAGQTNLMDFGELSNLERLKQLFEAFTTKTEILHLLDQSIRADGVQIFIGDESGYELLGDCSLVTAPYSEDDRVIGVLGVIGPTRMDYERVIPIVDVTAKLLSAALKRL